MNAILSIDSKNKYVGIIKKLESWWIHFNCTSSISPLMWKQLRDLKYTLKSIKQIVYFSFGLHCFLSCRYGHVTSLAGRKLTQLGLEAANTTFFALFTFYKLYLFSTDIYNNKTDFSFFESKTRFCVGQDTTRLPNID